MNRFNLSRIRCFLGRWGLFMLSLMLLWAIVPSLSCAQPVKQLTCVSTVFAPYVIEENGEITGVDVDVVKEAGKRLGIDITFKLKPWARLEMDVKEGTEACVAAYFRTPERLEYMDFTNVPLHITNYTLFVLADRDIPFTGLEDLKGFSVGVNRGFKTTPEFEEAVQKKWITVQEVEEDLQSFKKLTVGRVDAVLANHFVGAYQIKTLGLTNVKALFPPLSTTSAYLIFAKKSNLAYLVPKFDAALFDILQDGTYQQIFEKYTKVAE